MAQRENQYYYFAPDIAEILSVSVPTAYRIIARLNAELEAKGYLTVRGRISKKYFTERMYA
ncbi:MAG: hypothetical protein IJM51_08965 [Clostridia bacterium]|nr:hypothetical protein [Clostridia bacterium]